ncbi:MAG: helix-turn-helix domain-containing protein [Oscillibacter sp.]|nr:helix-turn-helix domain-containing protein [Oscillibacter sp.]
MTALSWWNGAPPSHRITAESEGNGLSFGEKLQEVRKAGGMTQETFAEELKVSR